MQAAAEILTEVKTRVEKRDLCALWMGLEKLAAWEIMSAEVTQLFVVLIRIANVSFVDSERFPDALELTNKAVIDKNGAGSPDGLRRRRKELAAIQINGQALVDIEEGENRGSQTICIYRLNYAMILSAWNPMRNVIRLPTRQEPENHRRTDAAVPLHQCGGEGDFSPFKEKKENTPQTPSIIAISNDGQKSEARGVGISSISSSSTTLEDDLEILYPDEADKTQTVLDRIKAWKIRDVKPCFCRPLTDMWKIIRQFEADFAQKHNMKDPGAVLRTRLVDGIETWSKGMDMKNRPEDVSPEIVEKFQQLIDYQFDTEDGDKKYLMSIVTDFKNQANVTFEQALKELLDLRGATRDQLIEWNSGD